MNQIAHPSGTVDFPATLKRWRKIKRCSQLDLALEAEISQRHLSFLESGRSKPSRDMVLALAEALQMPLRDRNHMLNAAGFSPQFQERALDNHEMKAVNQALEMTLMHHDPFPAIVVDRNWNLLLKNSAAERLVSLLGDPEEVWQNVDPGGNKNVYRMTFSEDGFRPFIANWAELSQGLLLRLQRAVSEDPCNQFLANLLLEASESIGAPDPTNERALGPVLPMSLRVGDVQLNTFSMISSFGTAQDVTASELKIETFFPADSFTEAFFRRLHHSVQ